MTNHVDELKAAPSIEWWLQQSVPDEEISTKDGGLFQDIRVIESLLDAYTCRKWSRANHRYEFHEGALSTSFELILPDEDDTRRTRVILCASLIDLADYDGNPNLLMTGISEATKAGVKILGRRFGKDLNEERGVGRKIDNTIAAPKKKREAVKMMPDAKIKKELAMAVASGNRDKVAKLKDMYDFDLPENGNNNAQEGEHNQY